jgi:1,4-alpha-glucan branching enzyme
MTPKNLNFGDIMPMSRYSSNRTRRHVDFFCHAPQATNVCLVGDFNDWQATINPMQQRPDGQWMVSLELHHGHHQYLFIVDGTPTLDPNAMGTARNDLGDRVSLIAVS